MPFNEISGGGPGLTAEQITAIAGSKPYKYDATTAPGVTNDINDTGASNGVGYEVGSVWIDTTANEAYRCVDNTDGAAVWINTTLTTDELGSMALQNAGTVAITGGSVTGITDLAVADGGTGASTEAGARALLDLYSKDETLSVDKYKVWTDWTIPVESSAVYDFLEHIDFVATAPFEMMVRIQGQAGTSLSHYASVGAYASTDEEIHRLLAAASTTITGTTGSGDSVTGTTRIVEGYRIKSQPDAGSHRIKFYVKAGTDRVQLAAALNVATTLDTFSSIELRYANQAIDDENLLFEDLTTATSGTIQIDQRPATGMTNPMTTAGDIIVGGASGTPARLAMGSALQVLRVNAGATALEYAAAGGGVTWQTITTNTNAVSGNGYIIDASSGAVILTLPATPGNDSHVLFNVKNADNAVVIGRNGSSIQSVNNDLSLVVDNYGWLVYTGSPVGWKNIFDGTASGDPSAPSGTEGFTAGGDTGSYSNVVDKFEYASNTTASDHGDLSVTRTGLCGQNSTTQGFSSGGHTGASSNVIDKFNFASNITASDHGDISASRSAAAGQSSTTQGFSSGGYITSPSNIIDKFDFASNTTATDHGDLSVARFYTAAQSSDTQGFTSGGYTAAVTNVIDRFDFSSNTTATDHGDVSVSRNALAGQNSTTQGFSSGGHTGASSNVIDKFNFSSNTTATDHGDLSVSRGGELNQSAGQSSSSHGFTCGGAGPSNVIDKFSFTSNTTASDHGDLSVARYNAAGISS